MDLNLIDSEQPFGSELYNKAMAYKEADQQSQQISDYSGALDGATLNDQIQALDYRLNSSPEAQRKGMGALIDSLTPGEMSDFIIQQMRDNATYQNRAAQSSADKAMDFSAQEAEKNRQFQLYMSNTAFQRVVRDLQAAGLNPALAYGQGGASTGSGSAGSGYVADMAKADSYSQNISESERLSKRERDSKIWSSVISGIFGLAGKSLDTAVTAAKAAAGSGV